jgi:hypothetical protein
MNVHCIIQRRIRDGEYLAVQLDTTIPLVEIVLLQQEPSNSTTHTTTNQASSLSNAQKLSAVLHFVTAMQFCIQKDRAYTDPLRPVGSIPNDTQTPTISMPSSTTVDKGTNINNNIVVDEAINTTMTNPSISKSDTESVDPTPEGDVPSPILDLTLADGLSDSSSSSENDDVNDDDNDDGEDDDHDNDDDLEPKPCTNDLHPPVKIIDETKPVEVEAPINAATATDSLEPTKTIDDKQSVTSPHSKNSTSSGRPLLVFANGMIVHDKFTFSLNVHEIQMTAAHYCDNASTTTITDNDDGYTRDGDVRLKAQGIVIEIIWPIATMVRITNVSS